MQIVALASLKGGVGKTSGAVFLAQALTRRGRVLVVDIDPNNNLTDYFCRDVDPEALEAANVYHVLTARAEKEAIRGSAFGLDVLPATPTLHQVGLELARDPGALLRFPSVLRRLAYDFIVIDTPPALVLELSVALYSADLVLCPVNFGRWTVQGFRLLGAEIQRVGKGIGKTPRLLALPAIVTEKEDAGLRSLNSWTPTSSMIIKSAAVKTAGTRGRALKEGTRSWDDFDRLAQEISR